MVFVIKSSNDMPPQTQRSSSAADPQAELRARIATLEAQAAEEPENLSLLINLGNAYYDIGDPAKSVEYYERSIKIRPDNPHVLVDCGSMYRELGQPRKALELFERAIAIDPEFPQAYFNKGTVLRMELGDRVGAAAAWRRYLQLEPKVDPQIRELLISEIEAASDAQ